jgi:hypothetical protein
VPAGVGDGVGLYAGDHRSDVVLAAWCGSVRRRWRLISGRDGHPGRRSWQRVVPGTEDTPVGRVEYPRALEGREPGRVRDCPSYRSPSRLLVWMRSFGELARVGIESTGAYADGLARVLRTEGLCVIEVDRPDHKTRRFQGSPIRSTPSRWPNCRVREPDRHTQAARWPSRSAPQPARGPPQRGRPACRYPAPDRGIGRHRSWRPV